MGDNLARDRARPYSTLLTEVGKAGKPEGEQAPSPDSLYLDDLDALPQPGSAYDAAYSRPGNSPETTLHVLLKDGYSKGYAWSNFDSVDTAPPDSPGGGPVLVVRFAGLEPTEVRISGSNLLRLHAAIGRHRIVWIREQPSKRGFDGAAGKADRAEIITRIDIRPWEPAPEKRSAGGG